MAAPVTWTGDRCVVGETTFQTIPPGLFDEKNPHIEMEGADFLLLKEQGLVEREARLLADLAPRRIFELGVLWGGSTAFLLEVTTPDVLVAIDQAPGEWPELRKHIAARGFDGTARLYGEMEQSDRGRLAEIVEENVGDQPLDLVVDDCSHLYEQPRASFNELFPRLRPGGVYVIEDGPWAHTRLEDEDPVGLWPEQVPLTRLIFEQILALPSSKGLIAELSIDENSVTIWRGEAEVDPSDFDISACSQPRGRSLLAPAYGPPSLRARLRRLVRR